VSGIAKVVIVGRPNVGKSTLFNRIAGRRRALTHDMPGMTRDRLTDVVELEEGRLFELTDTGGLEFGDDPMSDFADEIKRQAEVAIRNADLILFVVDGAAGLLPEDEDIARSLRRYGEKVLVIVNKIDTRDAEENQHDFHSLGFERLLAISAEHAIHREELMEEIEKVIPEAGIGDREPGLTEPVRLALIGRPNVGKSSLLNKLTGEERAVVSEIAGTTRDAIDSMLTRDGRQYLLIDTAGIRRKGKTTEGAEKLAVISSRKAIERAEIALVLIDASEGVTAQDATVAGYAEEEGRAAIILVNKWDIVEATQTSAKEMEDSIRQKLKFLAYAPVEFISAKTGRRVEKIFRQIDEVAQSYRTRVTTSKLNTILEKAVRGHSPPSINGKARRFYYATQLKSQPPTFAIFTNSLEPLHFSYRRYLENTFREELGLIGTPIRFVIRARKGMKIPPRES
jgi:GTPase